MALGEGQAGEALLYVLLNMLGYLQATFLGPLPYHRASKLQSRASLGGGKDGPDTKSV
jgi:hypothetical protein